MNGRDLDVPDLAMSPRCNYPSSFLAHCKGLHALSPKLLSNCTATFASICLRNGVIAMEALPRYYLPDEQSFVGLPLAMAMPARDLQHLAASVTSPADPPASLVSEHRTHLSSPDPCSRR